MAIVIPQCLKVPLNTCGSRLALNMFGPESCENHYPSPMIKLLLCERFSFSSYSMIVNWISDYETSDVSIERRSALNLALMIRKKNCSSKV
jgi:hypothetical protein